MSTSVERSSVSPWPKRLHEDIKIDLKEVKKPRYNHFRLESESSRASDEDTESICSLQEKETDVVRDTSDTESKSSNSGDEYEVEVEYEVASMSEDHDEIEFSTTDSESMMLAAAAAVICDRSLDAWITDVEDSDSSTAESSFGRSDFSTCVQCKGVNRNPLYRYCEKCFQNCRTCNKRKAYKCFSICQYCYKDRKKFLPPRPRRRRRRRQQKGAQPVKLDMLKNCLSGLSQDSGIGSSQECPSLGLDQIVVPEHLTTPGTSTDDLKSSASPKRKRQLSESSLSDFEVVKKPKVDAVATSDVGSEFSSGSSFASVVSSFSSETSGFQSDRVATPTEKSSGLDGKADSELCMFCNNAPKDSIFLHTNIAHRCCCYACAKRTLKSIKRCPICNGTVNKVVRIFTS